MFDTVRLSSKIGSSVNSASVYGATPTKQASNQMTLNPQLDVGGRFSPYFGGSRTGVTTPHSSSSFPSLDSGADSDGSFPTDSEDNYP